SERHRHFQLWSRDNHAEIIFSKDFFMQKLTYIHNNPVKAGIVHLPEHYIYSSASFHKEGKGLLEIEPFSEKV
ncbi:MAG: transposase, partial [Bacteroidota bacterium]